MFTSVFVGLTGQRFGRLVVVGRAENGKHKHSRWLCRCDCGREKIVLGKHLRSGATQSCGCLSKEKTAEPNRAKAINLIGQRFGRLIVVDQEGRWCHVRCDCVTKRTLYRLHS